MWLDFLTVKSIEDHCEHLIDTLAFDFRFKKISKGVLLNVHLKANDCNFKYIIFFNHTNILAPISTYITHGHSSANFHNFEFLGLTSNPNPPIRGPVFFCPRPWLFES